MPRGRRSGSRRFLRRSCTGSLATTEGDVFDKYFSGFQCFKDGDFGWQLRFELSHERAKKWLQEAIAVGVKKHHEAHFQEH